MDAQVKAKINDCLIGIKNRDVESLNELYDLIAHSIRNISLKYIHNEEDALDLEQDFWADIYTFADKFHYISNGFNYLCRIMTNMALNRYEKLRREQQHLVDVVDYNQIQNFDPNQSIESVELRMVVQNSLNKLDLIQQQILQMERFEHKTIMQISHELKMSKSQVGRIKSAAEEKLKQDLSQYFWEKSQG